MTGATYAAGMRDFDVTLPDGRTLHAQEGGAEDGSVVIYHHGTPMSRRLWEHWSDDAAACGLRLVGYDRPGYGGSTRDPGRTIASCAADTAALADAVGAGRFVTWGVSGGGPHALACAALLPDRVTAVASVAGVAPYGADGLEFLAGMGQDNLDEFGAALAGEPAVRAYLEAAHAELAGTTPEQLADAMATLLPDTDVAWLRAGGQTFLHAAMIDGIGATPDGWIDDDLAFVAPWGFDPADIGVPTLVVQGDVDLMVPFAHGQWLAARVPGVDSWLIEGEGHLSLFDRIGDVHAWLVKPTNG